MIRIHVVYGINGDTYHDAFTCRYANTGDFSVNWTPGGAVTLRMRDGRDETDRAVSSKQYNTVWTITVLEE